VLYALKDGVSLKEVICRYRVSALARSACAQRLRAALARSACAQRLRAAHSLQMVLRIHA